MRVITTGVLITLLALPTSLLVAPKPVHALDAAGLGEVVATCFATSISGRISGFISGIGGTIADSFSSGGQVPVFDRSNLKENRQDRINSDYQRQKEGFWDCIAWGTAKVFIAEIGASIIEWIDDGFEGNPSFIDDPANFFLDIADQAAASFLFNPDELAFLCSPIQGDLGAQIRIGLFYKYFRNAKDNRSCGLSDIIDNLSNAAGFLSGDMNSAAQSGWDDWFTITQIPENNMYGASLKAQIELDSRIAGAQSINRMLADWNSGFKSVTDGLGKAILPGDFLKNEFTEMFGADRRALEAADEINEIIAGIFNALLAQGITQGLSSFSTGGGGQASFSSRMRDLANNPNLGTINIEGGDEINDTLLALWIQENDQINAQVQSQLGTSGGGVPVQQSVVDLSDIVATANCWRSSSSNRTYVAQNAFDGGGAYTYYDSYGCGSFPLIWIKAEFPNGQEEMLDSISFLAYSSKYSFHNYGTQLARVELTDIDGNIYTLQIPMLLGRNESGVSVTLVVPQNIRIKKIQSMTIYSGNRLMLADTILRRHLLPVIDANQVPQNMQLMDALTYNPLSDVTAKQYPYYNQSIPLDISNVVLTITKGVAPFNFFTETGTYKLTFVATDNDGLTSTLTRYISVLSDTGGGVPPPAQITVPGIPAGTTLAEATSILTTAGFSFITNTPESSGTIPNGEVIEFDPPSGTSVNPADTITIVVSSGPSAP